MNCSSSVNRMKTEVLAQPSVAFHERNSHRGGAEVFRCKEMKLQAFTTVCASAAMLSIVLSGCQRESQKGNQSGNEPPLLGDELPVATDVNRVTERTEDSQVRTASSSPMEWITDFPIGELRRNRAAIINECRRDWSAVREKALALPVGDRRDEIAMILLSTAPSDRAFADFFFDAWKGRSSNDDSILGKWLNSIRERNSVELSVEMLKRLNGIAGERHLVGLNDLQRLFAEQMLAVSTPEQAFSRLDGLMDENPYQSTKGAFVAALAGMRPPVEVVEFVNGHIDDLRSPGGIDGISTFAAKVGFQDPGTYSSQIDHWSESLSSPSIATQFTSSWLRVDSQAATSWMGTLRASPTLDGAIIALFGNRELREGTDRAILERWLGKVSDTSIKKALLEKLSN